MGPVFRFRIRAKFGDEVGIGQARIHKSSAGICDFVTNGLRIPGTWMPSQKNIANGMFVHIAQG